MLSRKLPIVEPASRSRDRPPTAATSETSETSETETSDLGPGKTSDQNPVNHCRLSTGIISVEFAGCNACTLFGTRANYNIYIYKYCIRCE